MANRVDKSEKLYKVGELAKAVRKTVRAMHLYEDLVTIKRSAKLIDAAINRRDRVINAQ